jgi:diguanylate cyclase (GGDEF)-like protein
VISDTSCWVQRLSKMSDNIADIVLVTCDAALASDLERALPPGVRMQVITPSIVMAAAPIAASNAWIDLDCTTRVPLALEACPRRVFLYSRASIATTTLPPGLFLRKPLTPDAFAALFSCFSADSAAAPAPSCVRRETGTDLPDWVSELHEADLHELCQRVVAILPARFGYQHAALYLRAGDGPLLGLAETSSAAAIDLAVHVTEDSSSLFGRVAARGLPVAYEDLSAACRSAGLDAPRNIADSGPTRVLAAPLFAHGSLRGLLVLFGDATTAVEIPKTGSSDAIFEFVSRSLYFATQIEQARTEARVDGLTGLFNHRWLMESLEREIGRSARYGTPLSVVLLDLDGLKPINDRLGHAAGDAALRHVASRIRSILRQTDAAARIGGDEFVVLLPATDLDGARHVADRVSAAIRDNSAMYNDQYLPIRASVGAATWEAGWDAVRLVQAADQAMYEVKRAAREGLGIEAAHSAKSVSPT